MNFPTESTAESGWESELSSLQNQYRLQTIELKLEGQHLKLIKVANIDDLLDQVTDADQIPFWAELWPASIGLASFILGNHSLFKHTSVLELGAGVGLAGIAAKLAGGEVTQSDFLPEAFRFIKVNCSRNNVPVGRLLLADWRQFPNDLPQYDTIMGADILYEKTLHEALLAIFTQQLKSGGSIWLADPGRDYAKQFIQMAETRGWRIKLHEITTELSGKNFLITIYQLIREQDQK